MSLALVVAVSWRNWRAMPATLTWPQSPFVVQRAVRSGRLPSSLIVRVVARYPLTRVCGFSSATENGPLV